MKIRVDKENGTIDLEREPMSKSRFKAMCAIACVLLYIVLVLTVGAVLGEDGLIITSFFGLIACGGVCAGILCMDS